MKHKLPCFASWAQNAVLQFSMERSKEYTIYLNAHYSQPSLWTYTLHNSNGLVTNAVEKQTRKVQTANKKIHDLSLENDRYWPSAASLASILKNSKNLICQTIKILFKYACTYLHKQWCTMISNSILDWKLSSHPPIYNNGLLLLLTANPTGWNKYWPQESYIRALSYETNLSKSGCLNIRSLHSHTCLKKPI